MTHLEVVVTECHPDGTRERAFTFTADELWNYVRGEESVEEVRFPAIRDLNRFPDRDG